ncbi:MAG: HIT domain-containing protein [Pseudomonadota bacterium]|nr:HIT domain-containing protein [Pseudomonadota bacterium]MDE3037837.1 HIT domain-containing protein [Pseudomonadota bacterium]
MTFTLYPQLAADTIRLGDLPVCRVLLMNNRHFPWLVLAPRREGARELFDLGAADYAGVMEEVRHAAQQLAAITGAHKMNVAALGNIVPQLHIHVIARFIHDAAWPQPVWGTAAAPYPPEDIPHKLAAEIARRLTLVNITKM